MKKSKFLTICFSAFFGAGQMYLGMQKKGLLIMAGTACLIGLGSILHIREFMFLLPVIWFYAVFDANNAYPLSMEERKQLDDEFAKKWCNFIEEREMNHFIEQRHVLIGWGIVLIGAYYLFGKLVASIAYVFDRWWISSFVWRMYHMIPSVLFAAFIIWIGIKLIKRNVNAMEDQLVQSVENKQNNK